MSDSVDRLFDALEQDARVRKVSRMIPADGPLSPKHRSDVIAAVRSYMDEFDVSQQALAAGIGEAASTVGDSLNDNDRTPVTKRDAILRLANNWIELDAASRVSRAPENFVKTKVATRLFTIAKEVADARTMGLAYGPSGIGKSICAKAACAELPGAMYVLITRGTASVHGLISGIFAASRRKTRARWRPRYEDLVRTLEGSGRLLIIDQFHRLKPGALELLQDLHDECGIPVLGVGTVDAHKMISDDSDPHYGQVSSRFTIRRNLFAEMAQIQKRGGSGGKPGLALKVLFTVDDIRAIYSKCKLKLHTDAIDLLVQVANCDLGRGHLRRTNAIVHWALRAAAKAGRSFVAVEDIQAGRKVVLDSSIDEADLESPILSNANIREAKTA